MRLRDFRLIETYTLSVELFRKRPLRVFSALLRPFLFLLFLLLFFRPFGVYVFPHHMIFRHAILFVIYPLIFSLFLLSIRASLLAYIVALIVFLSYAPLYYVASDVFHDPMYFATPLILSSLAALYVLSVEPLKRVYMLGYIVDVDVKGIARRQWFRIIRGHKEYLFFLSPFLIASLLPKSLRLYLLTLITFFLFKRYILKPEDVVKLPRIMEIHEDLEVKGYEYALITIAEPGSYALTMLHDLGAIAFHAIIILALTLLKGYRLYALAVFYLTASGLPAFMARSLLKAIELFFYRLGYVRISPYEAVAVRKILRWAKSIYSSHASIIMFLREYEGKELFKEYGIPVPRGILVRSLEEAKAAAKELGFPVAVKAQVTTGGRGKAGLVKLARDEKELEEAVKSILGRRVGDEVVELLLIEEGVDIDKELYLSFTVDGFNRKIILMASPMGGIDIEEVARKYPGKLVRIEIDPEFGFSPFMARRARSKRFSGDVLKKLIDVTMRLRKLFEDYKLDLAEINPLVITKSGEVYALDAKILVDDAQIRLGRITRRKIEETPYSFVIINPEGNVGIIGNGAGLVMATCDLVKLMGGEPANFLDVGGGASADVVKAALERIVKELPKVKVILINIFGGITRCDEVAKGIVAAMEELKLDKPLVVRLVGTNEELGRKILEEHGIYAYKHMEDAIKKAVEIANA